jgi:2'-5' RNA ligase
LWPEDAVRGSLYAAAQALQKECGGRMTRRENLHQTLVFLGNVAGARLREITELASRLEVPAFELEFGSTGYWRRSGIVWAAPHATPDSLHAMVAALEQSLRRAGFRLEERPYASHITLIRDAHAPRVLPALAFDWGVRDFALLASANGERGVEYRVVAQWLLQPQPGR